MKSLQKLAAKFALFFALGVSGVISPTYAGIPVIDSSNLSQNIVSAVEDVAQTLQQIQQYSTQLNQYAMQLQQYQNMLQNTAVPSSYLWNQASSTMGNLLRTTNTLSNYKNLFGNLTNYLGQYQNITSYANSPCFSSANCTPSQWAALANSRILGSTAQQNANNASIQGLDQQQTDLQNDANTLMQLQANAQSATGQMQAIGYANQLASAQSSQLLQIRGLLIAEQNALVTRQQVLADQEAQQAAIAAQIRTGSFVASPTVSW
ncbi:P-type conjugative transfer protein TrbJ [Methylobacter psychrophilus]|uniref:P-type conjugative transfer protein TrbJ n=1 Tax=Methylobacter psychrophilus TaxID=96941 RepID=UPI0021D487C2|nr:P-type conjugative transfer protein TrbJ [Methylobacter psychrophilus]